MDTQLAQPASAARLTAHSKLHELKTARSSSVVTSGSSVFNMEETMERIFMDEDELLEFETTAPPSAKPKDTRSASSNTNHKVTLELVEEGCSFLADRCVSQQARPFFKAVSRTAVLEKVAFMNTRLGPKTKFMHSCREKAWGKYYNAYCQNVWELYKLTGSHPTSAWLCLHLFQLLLDVAYPLASTSTFEEKAQKCLELNDGTKDVVQYIGGSIVNKLRQKAASLKDTAAKEALIDCLSAMSDEEGSQNCSDSRMTKTLNRGGLVYLKPEANDFFHRLEIEVQEA